MGRAERAQSSEGLLVEAESGEVEPVHRLVGDTVDTLGQEDTRVEDGVGGERRVGLLDGEAETTVGAVSRHSGQLLRLVDRVVETRARKVREIRVADGTDRAAVEQLVDERIR